MNRRRCRCRRRRWRWHRNTHRRWQRWRSQRRRHWDSADDVDAWVSTGGTANHDVRPWRCRSPSTGRATNQDVRATGMHLMWDSGHLLDVAGDVTDVVPSLHAKLGNASSLEKRDVCGDCLQPVQPLSRRVALLTKYVCVAPVDRLEGRVEGLHSGAAQLRKKLLDFAALDGNVNRHLVGRHCCLVCVCFSGKGYQ